MLRIGFVTCVQLGLSCMEAIYEVGGQLQLALTLHDELALAKSGRVYLDSFCEERGIPLTKLKNINDGVAARAVRAARLDWLFIVGWSQIARAEILNAPRRGVLGMHPTLLPEGRGRAAVPWAILKGLSRTGVTLFRLDEGVDSGPIVAQCVVDIVERETATTLYEKVAGAHAQLLRENWSALMDDRVPLQPQDESLATTWPGRSPEDGRLMQTMRVVEADRMIRAVTRPYPGAFLDSADGRLRVWGAGRPFESLTANGDRQKPHRLSFRDGWLDASDWVLEPLP